MDSLPPRDLLARYRALCEAAGAARATDQPLSFADRADLYLAERALLLRLAADGASRPPAPEQLSLTEAAENSEPTARPSQAQPVSPRKGQVSQVKPESPPETSAPAPARPPVAATGPAQVFADGACQGNPGPGGYGVIVRLPGEPDREESGGSPNTTNNQMELTGAIVGLKTAFALGAGEVVVTSDSEYLVKGMKSWLASWERKGWKTSTGSPVKNRELWEQLSALVRGRRVTWNWVRGHVGHVENERCDELAVAAARRYATNRLAGR